MRYHLAAFCTLPIALAACTVNLVLPEGSILPNRDGSTSQAAGPSHTPSGGPSTAYQLPSHTVSPSPPRALIELLPTVTASKISGPLFLRNIEVSLTLANPNDSFVQARVKLDFQDSDGRSLIKDDTPSSPKFESNDIPVAIPGTGSQTYYIRLSNVPEWVFDQPEAEIAKLIVVTTDLISDEPGWGN